MWGHGATSDPVASHSSAAMTPKFGGLGLGDVFKVTNHSSAPGHVTTMLASDWCRMITAVAGDFNTELELSELEAFILEHEDTLGSAEASANQMVEQTR